MICAERKFHTRGFTLIELIIAISILGILTTIVASGLRTGLRVWTRGNQEIEDIESSQSTLSILRGQLQGALPLIFARPGDNAGTVRVAFAGDDSSLRLVSRVSFRDGPEAPPRWIEFQWQPDGDSGRLAVKEFQILSPNNTPASAPLWTGTVLDGKKFSFQYLVQRIPNQPKVTWVDQWPDTNLRMPAAVRMNFERRGRQYQILLPLDYAENSWNAQWFR